MLWSTHGTPPGAAFASACWTRLDAGNCTAAVGENTRSNGALEVLMGGEEGESSAASQLLVVLFDGIGGRKVWVWR